MAALPYMQLYVADYLSDTMHLTTEEHGAYMLIIFNYWQRGKAPHFSKLGAITKLNDRWTSVEDSLKEFFEVDEDGLWFHWRIEADLEKVRLKQKQASNAGKISAKKRAQAKKSNAKGIGNGRSNSVERKSNHTDTDTDTDTDNKKIKKNKYSDSVVSIFNYWKKVHNHSRSKLDDKRKKLIISRLKEGYNLDDLKKAIDGCKHSPYHQGQNDGNTVYDNITLILRDADNVDRFIGYCGKGKVKR